MSKIYRLSNQSARYVDTELTVGQLREYHSRGFTVVRNLISHQLAKRFAEEALRLSESPGPWARTHREKGDLGELRIDIDLHRRSDHFMKLAFSRQMLRVASHFINCDKFYFFYDQLFVKLANTKTRTQWHQDLPFWPLSGGEIPSIWLALTATDEQRSAVQYVEGSHRWLDRFLAVNAEERQEAISAGHQVCPDFHIHPPRDQRIVSHDLDPGDAVVHHPLVVHGSGPNAGTQPRVAVSFRYFSSETSWQPRRDTMFFPAAGAIPAGTQMCEQDVFPLCSLQESNLF